MTGPYATSWYDEPARKWRVRLTAEGQQVVAEFLERCPCVTAYMLKVVPSSLSMIRHFRIPDDEVEAFAREGVVRAVCRWDPLRGAPEARKPQINTVVAFAMKAAVNEMRRKWSDRLGLVGYEAAPDGDLASGALVPDTSTAVDDPRETEAEVDRILAALPAQERRAVVLRFGLCGHKGGTLQDVGDQMNVTRERVRQIVVRAVERLRFRFNPLVRDTAARVLTVLGTGPHSTTGVCRALSLSKSSATAVLGLLVADGRVACDVVRPTRTSGRQRRWRLTHSTHG
jgi:RNA polymerase sigma factor (sigma-70 family)